MKAIIPTGCIQWQDEDTQRETESSFLHDGGDTYQIMDVKI